MQRLNLFKRVVLTAGLGLLLVSCGGSDLFGGDAEQFSVSSSYTGATYNMVVNLPEGYEDSSLNYPVIYLLDAEFYSSMFRELVHDLNLSVIVVDVPNAGRRMQDYVPPDNYSSGLSGGVGDQFLDFLRYELVAEVDSRYRTQTHKRVLVGHSLGGLIGQYIALAESPTQRYFTDILASEGSAFNQPYLQQMVDDSAGQGSRAALRIFCASASLGNAALACAAMEYLDAQGLSNTQIQLRAYNGGHNDVVNAAYTDGLNYLFSR